MSKIGMADLWFKNEINFIITNKEPISKDVTIVYNTCDHRMPSDIVNIVLKKKRHLPKEKKSKRKWYNPDRID